MPYEPGEYSFEKGGYVLLSTPVSGVVDSVGEGAGWNEICKYISPLKEEIDNGGSFDLTQLREGGKYRFGAYTDFTTPPISWAGDTDTGIAWISSDTFGVGTGGVERMRWGSAECVVNVGGVDYNFRVEGDTNTHLLFTDASVDFVGVGQSAPETLLHVGGITTVRKSSASIPAASWIYTNNVLRVQGEESTGGGTIAAVTHALDDTSTQCEFTGYRARGTLAVPTAITNGTQMVRYAGVGYDGTAFGGSAAMDFVAIENWAVGAHGTKISFRATAVGSAADAEVAYFKSALFAMEQSGAIVSIGLGAATLGTVRIPNNSVIYGRNAANNGNVAMIYVDLADRVRLSDGSATIYLDGPVISTGSITASTWLNVGSATDAAATGDFASGLTGAARLFYDQSVPVLYAYTSTGTISIQLSQVAATATVFNATGLDLDFRIGGDTESNLFFVDASTDGVGIGNNAPSATLDVRRISTHTSGNVNAFLARGQFNAASASSINGSACDVQAQVLAGNAQNFTGVIRGVSGSLTHNGTGTITAGRGLQFAVTNATTGTFTSASGIFVGIQNNSTGTITTGIGIEIAVPLNGGGGTFTTYIGINVLEPTAASIGTRIAIQTGGGNVIFNENGGAWDVRAEGDSLAYMLFLNGSDAALENIAFLTTAEPNWQTMDRGIFIGDVTTVPTGNPASGFFHYSASGQPTWRDDGGVVYSFTQATGGQNVTNNVTDTASTAGTIPDIATGVYATDYVNLRNALFQLARMLKQDHDQFRAIGFLT